MIDQDRKVDLVFDMGTRIQKHEQWPDDAFRAVADGAFISGADRRSLREEWKKSVFFEAWAKEHPDLVGQLDW